MLPMSAAILIVEASFVQTSRNLLQKLEKFGKWNVLEANLLIIFRCDKTMSNPVSLISYENKLLHKLLSQFS